MAVLTTLPHSTTDLDRTREVGAERGSALVSHEVTAARAPLTASSGRVWIRISSSSGRGKPDRP